MASNLKRWAPRRLPLHCPSKNLPTQKCGLRGCSRDGDLDISTRWRPFYQSQDIKLDQQPDRRRCLC